MKKVLIKIVTVLLLCLILTSLIACSGVNGTKEVTEKIFNFEPLNTIKEGNSNIYLIVKLMDSDYWQVIIDGVRDAADACNMNVYYSGTNNETDWKGQQKLLEKAIENGADAIILAPDDSVELISDLQNIRKLDIPVILVDTVVNDDVFDVCFMTDNYIAGQNAAEEMISQLELMGHDSSDVLEVGVLVGTANSQTINERLAGFYQYWASNAPNKWTIIGDLQNSNGDSELANKLTEEFLNTYPNVAGLYGTNNGPTKALCSTVMKLNRTDVVVVGFDYSDEMRQFIESDDYIGATVLQRQYDMGYRAVESIVSLLDDERIDAKYEDTGVIIVNHNNMNDSDVIEVTNRN